MAARLKMAHRQGLLPIIPEMPPLIPIVPVRPPFTHHYPTLGQPLLQASSLFQAQEEIDGFKKHP